MENLTNLFESIGGIVLFIIVVVVFLIFRQMMLQWRWQFWNKNTFMNLDPQTTNEDLENLQKLRNRGHITEEQYNEAVSKLQEKSEKE